MTMDLLEREGLGDGSVQYRKGAGQRICLVRQGEALDLASYIKRVAVVGNA